MGALTAPRRVWQWAREVATDQGMDPRAVVGLAEGDEGPGFRIPISSGGREEVARVPVRVTPNPHEHPILKEVHACEIAGRSLEAASMEDLRDKVRALLERLAPGGALPLCWFRARASGFALPVHADGGRHLASPAVGGPRLKASELGEMRRRALRHLEAAGHAAPGEELDVGVLRPADLRLVEPDAVLRSLAGDELFLPAVERADGRPDALQLARAFRLGAPEDGEPPEETPVATGLLGVLRAAQRDDRAADAPVVYADRVSEPAWTAAEAGTDRADRRLVADLDDGHPELELEVRRTLAGELAAALRDDGITVFLAADGPALARDVAAYLSERGYDAEARVVR